MDLELCSRARLSRDARFDGKFFIAVRTSRVYCRPICPARTAKESNVRYFATAAAAAAEGYRPCLRCRPECSPGSPAWLGTPATVSRALKLIAESGLEDGGVEGLANRLGVGSRHLRRLVIQHLGASPRAVAETRRLHFAKKLIDETNLPMVEVALASGFGCVRRFNATIKKTYKRTPTQIRRLARQADTLPEDQYVCRLRYRPPYFWARALAFLSADSIPGVASVESGVYRRSISLNRFDGCIEVGPDASNDFLVVKVQFADARSLYSITERLRTMFDLNADWLSIAQGLGSDPVLARLIDASPGLRVPGCWSGFELTVRTILGLHESVRRATELSGLLAKRFGRPFVGLTGINYVFPSPEVLADARLSIIGVPDSQTRAIQALSRAVSDGRIAFDGIIDSDTFQSRLCEMGGISRSLAQYVTMRTIGEPDAFPSGDTELRRAAAAMGFNDLERRAEAWRPWRAYAAMYLLNESAAAGPDNSSRSRARTVSISAKA